LRYTDPTGHSVDNCPPGDTACEEMQGDDSYTDYPDYNKHESATEAAGLVVNWFFESGSDTYLFTESSSLTMDVMASPGMAEFRDAWAAEDYAVPYTWHHTIDNRGEGLTVESAAIFLKEHLFKNFLTQIGLGSKNAEGQIDSVGGILGSLDRIDAIQYDENNVAIVVHNTMGWASATRIPGTNNSLFQDTSRSDFGPGGTIWQIFYWIEPNPY
jgi:hypothetical protein